ncbi:glycosyltransferase family 2 protein [Winogradskyella sp. F6397]|uniref:Glycosyltransferase family 2 protein n=1 Tax=Winogradskyella marina TaxID=2785530 RepID=A0ABS0END9_9FLAO|nr:glycosyltransferase family A protein [Winogradskyella marina]MBF8150975.1 glycosyltransferase family 2 protein [Winogradskyella marina]
MNKQTKPLVSVSVVTYNHANYIKQCLDGILMQKTTFPYEIILGEDDSTDGTRAICKNYAERFPVKIRLFLRSRKDVIKINGNPTGRFNFMENLKSCQGKFIALCEGDDYWTDPLKLQKQVDLLESSPNLVACHHWQKNAVLQEGLFIEKDAPKKGHGYFPKKIATVENIFSNEMRVKTRTVMFRNIIDPNFFPYWFSEVAFGDVPLSFLLGKHGDFGFIDEEMAVYRLTGNGVSTAGLEELGNNQFYVQHFKNWIDIWDFADKHYNYKFHKQASKTVISFYRIIESNLPTKMSSFLHIMKFNLLERRISLFKSFTAAKWLCLQYFKKNRVKVKKKIRY